MLPLFQPTSSITEKMSRADYEFLKEVGSGSFGKVSLVRRKADNKNYVIKQLNIQGLSPREQQDAINEVNILAKTDHPNVIAYFDSFVSSEDKNLNIVMEFASNGNLYEMLRNRRGKLMSEADIWRLFIQIVSALNYIHSLKILHRDIKSMNIFLDSANNCKIGDFGVSKILENTKDMAKTVIGTPFYLSPEMCENLPYDERSDVWALGCVLFEMCTLRHPFEAKNQGALVLKIMTGQVPSIPSVYSPDLHNLVRALLNKKPKVRPTTMQILGNSIIIKKCKEMGMIINPLPTPSSPIPATRPNIEKIKEPIVNHRVVPTNDRIIRSSTPNTTVVKKEGAENKVVLIRPTSKDSHTPTVSSSNSVKTQVLPSSTAHVIKRVAVKVETKQKGSQMMIEEVRNLPKIPISSSVATPTVDETKNSTESISPISSSNDETSIENTPSNPQENTFLQNEDDTPTPGNPSTLTIKHEKSKERHINRLLDKIAVQEAEISDIKEKCKQRVTEQVLNQLITFFRDSINNQEVSEEETQKFVLGRISYQDLDVLHFVYKVVYLLSTIDDMQKEIEGCCTIQFR